MELDKSGGPWQTKATIPMQTSENALTVRMVTLLNTSSKENETLLAVGTAYVQGGEVAARGRILLFSLGKNTDNPQTLVSEVYSKELKGAISALASLQGHLLIASGPKIILHKWTGTELNGIAFFDAPPLHVVSLNIVREISLNLLLNNSNQACPIFLGFWGRQEASIEEHCSSFLTNIDSESIDGKHVASVTTISRESECTMGVNDKIGDSGERFFSSENSSLLVEAVDVNSTSDGEEQEKCCEELSNLQARQNEQGDSLDGIVDDTGSKSASSVLINATADRNCTTLSQIDEELLQEVVNMGFDRNQLVESLCNRIQNEMGLVMICLKSYGGCVQGH
ncbi:hypothetical protein Ahy_B04g072373 [Arachis hypogaea]|uniref:UBA domain-containing protein n=1 Tax=Arachis hypogaea TaxID=3818 RepID=A0A444ZN02_ARAHY|nr:hypothetical protein Ahy_B04g072373 [Arachis hypogaea]